MKGFFHDKVKIFGQEMKNKTKRIAPSFMCLAVLISSAFSFMTSAASSVIVGSVEEVGEGEKSPTNPYELNGVTEGVPSAAGALYGNGTYNDTYDPNTGIVTRRWACVELDRSWKYSMSAQANHESYTTIWVENYGGPPMTYLSGSDVYCSHLPTREGLWTEDKIGIMLASTGRLHFRVPKSIATNISELLNWFDEQKAAGTPVTVIYPIGSVEEEYYSNSKNQYFNFTGSSLSANPPATFNDPDGISYLRLDGNTTYMGWWSENPFSLNYQLNNGGQYFQLSGGNKYTFSFSFSDSRVNTYSGVSISLDLHLTSLDGSRETIVSQPAYIDGNDFYFSFDYTAEEGVVCTWISLNFDFGSSSITDCAFSLNKASIVTNISPETPLYPPPDTGDLDNMEGLEGQVNNQNQQGMNNAEGYQDSALTTIVKYVAGFQAVAAIIGKIGDIPFIGALLTLSVSIGLFAFLLGMVGSVYRSRNHGDAQVKRDPSTTIFTKWRGGK